MPIQTEEPTAIERSSDFDAFIAAFPWIAQYQGISPEMRREIQQIAFKRAQEVAAEQGVPLEQLIEESDGAADFRSTNRGAIVFSEVQKAVSEAWGQLAMTQDPVDPTQVAESLGGVDPLEVMRRGGPENEDEQAALDDLGGTSSEIAAWAAAYTGNVDPRTVDWMLRDQIGLTIDSVDWDHLYWIAMQYGADEIDLPERIAGETDQEYRTKTMLGLMQAGPNNLNSAVWQTYLESVGNWGSSFKIGDWLYTDLKAAADRNGLQLAEVTTLARSAKKTGLSVGEAADLYSWAKDTGITMWDLPGRGGYPQEDLSYMTPQAKMDPNMGAASGYLDLIEQQIAIARGENPQASQLPGGPVPFNGVQRDMAPKATYGGMAEGSQIISHEQMMRMYRLARDKYDSETVARVAMHDSSLAERLYNDPYSLSIEELKNVDVYVGGVENIINQDPAGGSWLQERLLGTSGDVVQVDKDGAREAARQLAASWNMPGLSDSQLDRIVQGVVGPQLSVIKQAMGNPFNPKINDDINVVNVPSPYAVAAKDIRGTAEYRELFGQMQDGESEEQYAGRFNSESQELLGDRNLEVIRAGMRTGDRNTVGQAALLSGAGSDSSTFRQRLARLGNAFKDMT